MNKSIIKDVLKEKGIDHLYHANTVLTSCTFLEQGGLFPRGIVEDYGWKQTPQRSDNDDKQFGIYYDLFFDSVDIAARNSIKGYNDYGPVLFEFSIDVIDELDEGSIFVTIDNSIRWYNNMPEKERYFITEDELRRGYCKGVFKQHFTIRNRREGISLSYLERIVLDNPGKKYDSLFIKAKERLEVLIQLSRLAIPLEIRYNATAYSRVVEKKMIEKFSI